MQPCEEASDAADRNAEDQRQHEVIAGGVADAGDALGDLDADHASDQAADDRLPGENKQWRCPVLPYQMWIFEPDGELAADDRAEQAS